MTASVSGRGSKRVLEYNIRRREAQRVTFSEVAGVTRKPIGTVNGGGRGTLRFSPAPGRGRRTIEAQFELDGLPAERKTVARFKPPSPKLGRVRGLRVRRQGEALLVSWRRVAGAKRYEVVAATSGAGQRVKRLRKASVRLKRIPRASSGIVTVRAVDSLREGRRARKKFRRAVRRASRFERLPRAPRLRSTPSICFGAPWRPPDARPTT